MTVRRGNSGDDVQMLQVFLNDHGYRDGAGHGLVVDGVCGIRTEQAVEAFQRANGLVVDGIFGRASEAAALALGFGSDTARIEGVDVSYFCTDGHGKSLIDWSALT